MNGKGANTPTQDPQLAGLGEKETPTQEQSIAHTYFAGVRNLKLVWIMQPVNQFTRETDGAKSVKNYANPLIRFTDDLNFFPGAGEFKD